MRRVPGGAGAGLPYRRLLGRQHQFVDVALGPRKPSVDREAAGDVGGVAVEFAAGIDQQQLAVGDAPLVVDIVQYAGVWTAGDDRRVGRRLGAGAAKGLLDHGLDLVFEHAGPGGSHRLAVGLGGNRRGAPHQRDLGGVLDQSHLVEQGAYVVDRRRRGDTAAGIGTDRIEGARQALVPGHIVAERVVDRRLIGEVLGEHLVERADGMGLVHRELLAGRVRAVAKAIPDLALRILLATQQDRARGVTGDQQQQRLGFAETGQIVEVAVVTIAVMRVPIADHFGRRRHHCDAAATLGHAGQQAVAARLEWGWVAHFAPYGKSAADSAIIPETAAGCVRRSRGQCIA